jgi:hypothetical protein
LIRWQYVEVRGAILIRRAVHTAAVIEDQIILLAGANVFGTLEHHVLEQMRKTGATGSFVARADVVCDVYRDYRRAVILHRDYTQTVSEARLFQFDVGISCGLSERDTRKREKDYRDKQPSMQSHAIKLLYKIPRAIRLIVTSEDDSVAPLVGWLESRDLEFMRQRHDCQGA